MFTWSESRTSEGVGSSPCLRQASACPSLVSAAFTHFKPLASVKEKGSTAATARAPNATRAAATALTTQLSGHYIPRCSVFHGTPPRDWRY